MQSRCYIIGSNSILFESGLFLAIVRTIVRQKKPGRGAYYFHAEVQPTMETRDEKSLASFALMFSPF